jgi:hypothetical protein
VVIARRRYEVKPAVASAVLRLGMVEFSWFMVIVQ